MNRFASTEEAWFWFSNQQALTEGIEKINILRDVEKLYRNHRLNKDHLLVLRHYGRRGKAPDTDFKNELRAKTIWDDAMAVIEPVFVRRGVVEKVAVGA